MKIKKEVVIFCILILAIKLEVYCQITDEEIRRYQKYLLTDDIKVLGIVSKKYNEVEKKYKKYLENKLDTMESEQVAYYVGIGKWEKNFKSRMRYGEPGHDVEIKTNKKYLFFFGNCSDKDTVFVFINNKFYMYFIPFIECSTNFHIEDYRIPFGLKKVIKLSIIHRNYKVEFYWPKEAKMVKISYFENLDTKWYVLFTNYGFDIY